MSDQENTARRLERLERVRERVLGAAKRSGRDPDEVTLVAVSKTFPSDTLRALYDAGVRDFGENYVQEWRDKRAELPEDIRWHFIGHLQSNKAKYLANTVHLVHSANRASVLDALARRADEGVDVLLQVNVAEDEAKFGVRAEEVSRLLEHATSLEGVRVRGLMTIPPYVDDPEHNRPHFARLAALAGRCAAWLEERDLRAAHPLEHLSMGMSGDFEVAIEEGATLVRVGSAIFGARDYSS